MISRPLRPRIRWMIRRDLATVLRFERESFEFPWSEEDFVRCLRQRNCIGMVAESPYSDSIPESLWGYVVYELLATEVHVLNFNVAKDCRLQGIGSAMVEKLVSKLAYGRRDRIVLEVRETNLDAQKFFAKQGFRATRVLRNYYEDTPGRLSEDAYEFQRIERAAQIPEEFGGAVWAGGADA